jgi:ectoine hydroxylase-related dioxygenase (phytanoyl-CoA dioxygenase family)
MFHSIRCLMIDVPLFVLLLTYASIIWFSYVHDVYLVPQLKALPFTKERSLRDLTYYTRVCSQNDMSTTNGNDLFLPINATPQDAYSHQLKHGFTVLPNILQPKTCENLRNYIVQRNSKITEKESIFVIEGDKRSSFGLGTEEVSVRQALKEIGNSPRLRPALEAILGPDPALIELTAITSMYGAVAQWWHDDVVAAGSPVQFGRAFGPSYSVFIQLQNTTKEMGATGCCPGTHFCSEGNMEEFCSDNGFQLVNDNGVWSQGDALLMNMNSWHRGGAHTDPDGLDRVMLILTFVPKPVERAETRQLSQGITFSLRWDMWGHTLNDLANADTAMKQPWTTLRALGLYKSKSANWGIDYITSASIRTANKDNGFHPDDLEEFLSRGGFPFLPKWLQNYDIDWDAGESWPEFINGTKEKCKIFFSKVSKVAVVAYLVLGLLCAIFTQTKKRLITFRRTLIRAILMVSLAYILFYIAKSKVDQTGWAKDILAGRRYTSTVDIDRQFAKQVIGPRTYPTSIDVLIETRYGSEQLSLYNDFITKGHPGNVKFNEIVNSMSQIYKDSNDEFKEAIVENVAYRIFSNQGRFLYQGPDGYWIWLYDDGVYQYVRGELDITSNKLHSYLAKNIRHIASEYKYGKFRYSALSVRHAVPYLEILQMNTLKKNNVAKSSKFGPNAKPVKIMKGMRQRLSIPIHTTRYIRKVRLQRNVEYLEPYVGAWIAEEDEVEIFENSEWSYAVVLVATGRGDFQVKYPDGSIEVVDKYSIRPFVEYRVGEKLHCYHVRRHGTEWCTVQNVSRDGLDYSAKIHRNGEIAQLKLGDLKRIGQPIRTKYKFKGPNYHQI